MKNNLKKEKVALEAQLAEMKQQSVELEEKRKILESPESYLDHLMKDKELN